MQLSSIKSAKKQYQNQLGMTFWGTLVVLAAVVLLGIVGLKSAPAYMEFKAIKAAVEKIGADSNLSQKEVAAAFNRQASIDSIESIKGDDLIVEGGVVTAEYQKVVPLFGNVSLLFDFKADSN